MQTSLMHLTAADSTLVAVRTWLPEGVAPLRLAAPGASPAAGAEAAPADGEPGPNLPGGSDAAPTPETQTPPRAVIQVVHGMAEHSARYARFAEQATARGYAVVADDHRGHGLTAQDGNLGHVADRDGWDLVLEDLSALLDAVRSSWPGAPVVLMGHSWGSFLVRLMATRRGGDLAGLIVMGTGGDPGLVGGAGAALASVLGRLRGRGRPSKALDRIVFASYNRGLGPVRTVFDWLSRDPAEVDAYIEDPWCGFLCSNSFFRDLARGTSTVARPEVFAATPAGLPVLVMSGGADPVGAHGRGPRQVADAYRRAGVRDVALRILPGARHELLNETNRADVTGQLLDWVEARL